MAYDIVTDMLTDKRLSEALRCLYEESEKREYNDIRTDVEQLQADYARLLQYFTQGTADPTRHDQLDAFYARAWELTERFRCSDRLTDTQLSDDITLQQLQDYQSSELQGEDRDQALGRLFQRIKSCFPISREVRRELHGLMLNEEIAEYERATLLSAIMLNLLQRFDASMLEAVYAYTLDDQPAQIRAQAIVTLVLCGITHDNRIEHEPRLRELYQFLAETEADLLSAIQISLYCSKSVPSVMEQISSIVKMQLSKTKEEKSQMTLSSFIELFHDGSDHEYPVFSKQNSKMKFFADPANEHHWLMPFTEEQPKVKSLMQQYPDAMGFIKMFKGSMIQCSTSKYMQLLLIEKHLDKVIEQIKDQMGQLPFNEENIAPLDEFFIQRNYIHDVYRYFKLNAEGKKLNNPIPSSNPCFSRYKCLKYCIEDPDRLEHICKALMDNKKWEDASILLKRLTQKRVTPELLGMQIKAGEMCENYYIAQEGLQRYQSLYTTDEAFCLRRARDYDQDHEFVLEENYLHESLKQYVGSAKLQLQMATCLNNQRRVTEALSLLESINPDEIPDEAATYHQQLAYAYLMQRQIEEAEKHVRASLELQKTDKQCHILGIVIAILCHDTLLATQRLLDLWNPIKTRILKRTELKDILNQSDLVECLGDEVGTLALVFDSLRQCLEGEDSNMDELRKLLHL